MRAWAFVAGTVAVGCGGVFGVRSQIGNEPTKAAVERQLRPSLAIAGRGNKPDNR
jgi:hypothetical protein